MGLGSALGLVPLVMGTGLALLLFLRLLTLLSFVGRALGAGPGHFLVVSRLRCGAGGGGGSLVAERVAGESLDHRDQVCTR